jgi:hypothetical protein
MVHMREVRHDGADVAGRLGSSRGRVKMLDQNLVHALVGGKDPDCGLADLLVHLLSANIALTRGQGSLFLDL